MSSPFSQQYMDKSPIAALTQQQEAKLPENLKKAIEAKDAGSPLNQEAVDLGTVKSDYKGKEKKLPFPGKEMYEGTGDYAKYKGKYTKEMLDMNANYTYQHNKANKPGYVEDKKKQMEAEGLSPLNQTFGDKEPSIMKEKKQPRFIYNPKSDELNKKQRDSLNTVARKSNKGFYSPEFDVSVDPEDGVLTQKRNEKHPDFSNYHFQIKE
tara:strand:- start:317 stop:943 length:627 start_codon:yes stop_codon:yes gene_type:complete